MKKINFQLGNGQFFPCAIIDEAFLGANYELDEIPRDADNYFEVMLSAARSQEHEGHWLQGRSTKTR